jgi:uroporphyrinogen-III synthase
MDLLAGWTVAVTADRRAAEQADLLQRRGADVLLVPTVETTAVDDALAAEATRRVLAEPLQHVVITTGIGLRSWVAMAWSWGLGEPLLDLLNTTPVWARGAKAVGALVGEGVDATRHEPGETMAEVLDALLATPLAGARIAVQSHGGDQRWFVEALTRAGAEVLQVPVYRVAATTAPTVDRLVAANAEGQLDAITFTSPMSLTAVAEHDGLVSALRARQVACACVGPVTAAAATAAGLSDLVVPPTHRMGSMLRSLGEQMAGRGTSFDVGGVRVRHQGSRIAIDDAVVRLTPRERRLLEAMLDTRGAVVSKERLAATAWDDPVDGHTVEVTVNRLRRKLGRAAAAVETTNRRGYRIAV